MANHPPPSNGGHETSDVQARPVFWIGLLLLMFAGAAAVSMSLFQRVMRTPEQGARGQKGPVGVVEPGPDSPAYPIEDWRGVHNQAEQRLKSVGWVERTTGTVHIPIQTAMDLIVQRGLPSRPKGPDQVDPAKEPE